MNGLYRYKGGQRSRAVSSAAGELERPPNECRDRRSRQLRDQGARCRRCEVVEAAARPGHPAMQVAARGAAAPGPTGPRRTARSGGGSHSKTVSRDQLLAITRELATLLRAGPAARSRARDPDRARGQRSCRRGACCKQIRDDVRGGKSLSQALDARGVTCSRASTLTSFARARPAARSAPC